MKSINNINLLIWYSFVFFFKDHLYFFQNTMILCQYIFDLRIKWPYCCISISRGALKESNCINSTHFPPLDRPFA